MHVRESEISGLAALPAPEQVRLLVELVREHASAALRQVQGAGSAVIDAQLAFRELGLDSLALVDLHTRLNAATGLAMPPTVAFDHPTPAMLAEYLRAELLGAAPQATSQPQTTAQPPALAADDDPIAIVGI